MHTRNSPGQVLLLHPDLDRLGGIETHIIKLKRYLKIPVESVVLAKRPGESGTFRQVSRLLSDFRAYRAVLRRHGSGLVHANPTLEPKGLFREGLCVWMAGRQGYKTLVFFHGWRESLARRIDKHPALFRMLYGKVDAFIVLARRFEADLRRWGVTQPIHREVTTVDDRSLEGFDLEASLRLRRDNPVKKVFFAGRILRGKGIFQTLEAIGLLQAKGCPVELVVVGNGPDLEAAKRFAVSSGLKAVHFQGRVPADAMSGYYRDASLFCFPTSLDEGIPSVLVEAMAHGLPVITAPVGGIPEVIQSSQNGILLQDCSAVTVARAIEESIGDGEFYEAVARRNYAYAQERFLASQSAGRMEAIYRDILES